MRRVFPAHQRFVPDDGKFAEADDRLVVGTQLLRPERHPKVVLELKVFARGDPVVGGVERHVAGASEPLGAQQGHVGPHQDLVGGIGMRADAAAEAQRHGVAVASEFEGLVERLGHA